MRDDAYDDIPFPPDRVHYRRQRQYARDVLPGREQVIEGKKDNVEERSPWTNTIQPREEKTPEIQFFDDRTDHTVEDQAERHRQDKHRT
jgi:hypothetical protein